MAQTIFDNGFLLPFAPDPPEFFLIPGDNQVTVMWRPSPRETDGRSVLRHRAARRRSDGSPNALYDPNYRQFDVEGYRVYRGRVDAPNSLQLLAQFDYAGTVISDFAGQVNPTTLCAPELGITTDCPVTYDPIAPGVPRAGPCGRAAGRARSSRSSWATGWRWPTASDRPGVRRIRPLTGRQLRADRSVRSSRTPGCRSCTWTTRCGTTSATSTAVTAFDINSIQSGPTQPRIAAAHQVGDPAAAGRELPDIEGTMTSVQLVGAMARCWIRASRSRRIDPTTGRVQRAVPARQRVDHRVRRTSSRQVLSQPGSFTATLDSLQLGSPYDGVAAPCTTGRRTAGTRARPVLRCRSRRHQEIGVSRRRRSSRPSRRTRAWPRRYGGNGSYTLQGKVSMKLSGPDYTPLLRPGLRQRPGRASPGAPGCAYNGGPVVRRAQSRRRTRPRRPERGQPGELHGQRTMSTLQQRGRADGGGDHLRTRRPTRAR